MLGYEGEQEDSPTREQKIVQPLRRRVPRGIQVQLQEAPVVRRLFDTAVVQSLLGNTEVKDPDREWTD